MDSISDMGSSADGDDDSIPPPLEQPADVFQPAAFLTLTIVLLCSSALLLLLVCACRFPRLEPLPDRRLRENVCAPRFFVFVFEESRLRDAPPFCVCGRVRAVDDDAEFREADDTDIDDLDTAASE